MDGEFDLDMPRLSASQTLKMAMRKGNMFFSVRQVATMLGMPCNKVYDRVYLYRLDAFLIGGEYRIPWTSIASAEEDQETVKDQFFAYLAYVRANGMSEDAIMQLHVPDTGSEGDAAIDWYDISSMGLPYSAMGHMWSAAIGSSCDALSIDPSEMVGYPTMFDFLVDHEVVNLPVPYKVNPPYGDPADNGQLLLF